MHPVCETTIYIPCDDFKIHEILVSPREKFHFSVSRSDIFDWSHDWSTIQFSKFTGQISVKPMLSIPHPTDRVAPSYELIELHSGCHAKRVAPFVFCGRSCDLICIIIVICPWHVVCQKARGEGAAAATEMQMGIIGGREEEEEEKQSSVLCRS